MGEEKVEERIPLSEDQVEKEMEELFNAEQAEPLYGSQQEVRLIGLSFQEHALKLNNSRTDTMDYIGIPEGWVVDARIGDPMWEKVRTYVLPLKPKVGLFGFRSPAAKAAQRDLERKRNIFGPDAFMLMVPDDEAEYGFSAFFVTPEDLQKNPETLLTEFEEASKERDLRLASSIRCAYFAVSGFTDMK